VAVAGSLDVVQPKERKSFAFSDWGGCGSAGWEREGRASRLTLRAWVGAGWERDE
jgi:hypothetical protein